VHRLEVGSRTAHPCDPAARTDCALHDGIVLSCLPRPSPKTDFKPYVFYSRRPAHHTLYRLYQRRVQLHSYFKISATKHYEPLRFFVRRISSL